MLYPLTDQQDDSADSIPFNRIDEMVNEKDTHRFEFFRKGKRGALKLDSAVVDTVRARPDKVISFWNVR